MRSILLNHPHQFLQHCELLTLHYRSAPPISRPRMVSVYLLEQPSGHGLQPHSLQSLVVAVRIRFTWMNCRATSCNGIAKTQFQSHVFKVQCLSLLDFDLTHKFGFSQSIKHLFPSSQRGFPSASSKSKSQINFVIRILISIHAMF